MKELNAQIKLDSSAMIAGIGLPIMVLVAPYAELYAYPKPVTFNHAEQTTINIRANEFLFVSMLLSYLIIFIYDVVVT